MATRSSTLQGAGPTGIGTQLAILLGTGLLVVGLMGGVLIGRIAQQEPRAVSLSSPQVMSPEAIRAQNYALARSVGMTVFSPERFRSANSIATTGFTVSPEAVRAANFVAASPADSFSPEEVRARNYGPNEVQSATDTFSPEAVRARNG